MNNCHWKAPIEYPMNETSKILTLICKSLRKLKKTMHNKMKTLFFFCRLLNVLKAKRFSASSLSLTWFFILFIQICISFYLLLFFSLNVHHSHFQMNLCGCVYFVDFTIMLKIARNVHVEMNKLFLAAK